MLRGRSCRRPQAHCQLPGRYRGHDLRQFATEDRHRLVVVHKPSRGHANVGAQPARPLDGRRVVFIGGAIRIDQQGPGEVGEALGQPQPVSRLKLTQRARAIEGEHTNAFGRFKRANF